MSLAQELLILPERFREATFNDKINKDLLNMLRGFVDKFPEFEAKGMAPALFGSPGIGKTYAAAATARALAARGVPVLWVNTVQELNLILDLHDFRSKSYFTHKASLLNSRVVIFDDFGQLRDFSRIRELFFEIVDERYSWKKPTIFTANFSSSLEEEIAKCFNSALARRILSMSKGMTYVA